MGQERAIGRREAIAGGAGLLAVSVLRPALATPAMMEAAIHDLVGEAQVQRGRVRLDISPLVENGNTVPLTVKVEGPLPAGVHVRTIAVFNEKNPQPNVAVFRLSPRAGQAGVGTRMRLATSQTVTALAELSDGTWWSDEASVIVTLAACVEG